jgi:hypothetical protein
MCGAAIMSGEREVGTPFLCLGYLIISSQPAIGGSECGTEEFQTL